MAYSAAGVLRPGTGNVPPAKEWLTNLDAHTQIPAGQYNLVVIALGVNDCRFSRKNLSLHTMNTFMPLSNVIIVQLL